MLKSSIISYLDEDITKKIQDIQQRLFELTGSRACLDLWEPHLTVGDGVTIKDEDLEDFYSEIQNTIADIKPFSIEIKDYDFMDNWPGGSLEDHTPYVIYLNVVVNNELLSLVNSLIKVTERKDAYYQQLQGGRYIPHITVAYKDLTREGFEKAKKLLSEEGFSSKAIIDHVSLSREDENGRFNEFKRFKFGD